MAVGQAAQAVADYRSAAALNPGSSQAAAGLQQAWRSLQTSLQKESLYALFEASPDATAEELRKAYRKAALRWHPDKQADSDAAQRAAAENRWEQVAAAWAVLSDEDLRAAYDRDCERGGAG